MHIEHINISAPMDLLIRVRDFYCELFELTEGFRPASSIRGFWLYADGKALIHLAESNAHSPNQTQGCLDHIAFQTTGLRNILRRLGVMGVSFVRDSFPEIGMTQLFLTDPAGVGVEINFLHEAE